MGEAEEDLYGDVVDADDLLDELSEPVEAPPSPRATPAYVPWPAPREPSTQPEVLAECMLLQNVPWWLSTSHVTAACACHGTVRGLKVMEDRLHGKSRGVVLVEFADGDAAARARAALHGSELGGQAVRAVGVTKAAFADAVHGRGVLVTGTAPRDTPAPVGAAGGAGGSAPGAAGAGAGRGRGRGMARGGMGFRGGGHAPHAMHMPMGYMRGGAAMGMGWGWPGRGAGPMYAMYAAPSAAHAAATAGAPATAAAAPRAVVHGRKRSRSRSPVRRGREYSRSRSRSRSRSPRAHRGERRERTRDRARERERGERKRHRSRHHHHHHHH